MAFRARAKASSRLPAAGVAVVGAVAPAGVGAVGAVAVAVGVPAGPGEAGSTGAAGGGGFPPPVGEQPASRPKAASKGSPSRVGCMVVRPRRFIASAPW